MNNVYFACRCCRLYIGAGYRWAAHQLSDVVETGQPVSVEKVLSAQRYWRGVEEEEWLRELLPRVRQFLEGHREHEIVYGDDESFCDRDKPSSLFWTEIEDIDPADEERNANTGFFWSPRVFVQVFNFRKWEEVENYLSQRDKDTWWFSDPDLRYEARRVFEYLVRRKMQSS